MKITVINNKVSERIPCPDGTSVAPGVTKVMAGRSLAEAQDMINGYLDTNEVIILTQLEGIDREVLVCDMKNPADPAGGVGTVAGCGFDLEDQAGAAANVAPQMYFGAFEDAACTIPATTATLDTAAAGTIDAGAGTNLLTVTPSAAGALSVTLTDTADEIVYMRAWPVDGSYLMDNSEIDQVEFTA
jgi:hypothetical protein